MSVDRSQSSIARGQRPKFISQKSAVKRFKMCIELAQNCEPSAGSLHIKSVKRNTWFRNVPGGINHADVLLGDTSPENLQAHQFW